MKPWCLILTVALFGCCDSLCGASPTGELKILDPVAVVTHSGRTLRGELDPRTDEQFVWLTAACDGVAISSRIAVADIQRIVPAAPVELPPLWEDASSSNRALPRPHEVIREATALGRGRTKVRSLEVAATMANCDSDSSIDGVRLWLQPLGRDGLVTPASGTARVELLLEESGPHNTSRFRTVETWSEPVDAGDFAADGAVIQLPLRRVKPESLLERFPMAILRVRLNVPSVGAFDAIVSDLPLRTFSYNRDQQQQLTGRRRLPRELAVQ